MEEKTRFQEFFQDSKVHRQLIDNDIKEIKAQVTSIQLSLAKEEGKDTPARLLRIEHELELLRSFRDSVTGSINSLKWVLGIGFGFVSSLLVGLIILVVRELMLK